MAPKIDAACLAYETTNSSISKTPHCETFPKTWKRIKHQVKFKKSCLFLWSHSNFWVRKFWGRWVWWMKHLEMFTLCHHQEWTRGTPQAMSWDMGHPLQHSPCPRLLAVPFWGAAWESPTARGSGGGVLPTTLEIVLQCWVLPLHLQGKSRLQTHQVNCIVLYVSEEWIWGWGLQVWNASQGQELVPVC